MSDAPFKQYWVKLTGEKNSFSMENRVFNAISIVSALILCYSFVLDLYLGQQIMCVVLAILLVTLSILYYFSRVRRLYKPGTVVYAFASYGAMVANFYSNSGISGPTLLYFCLTFILLIAISPPRFYWLWLFLHISIATTLIASGLLHPDWIKSTYSNEMQHNLDVFSGYIAVIVFGYVITNYLRKYYHSERKIAASRLEEILVQNEQIKVQNQLLEQANAEKNKLFSIVSHDLRSPIDSITGYLGILSESDLSGDERKEIEQELYEQTRYTSDLLLNLLYWSKNQMNGVNPKLASINLATMIEDARNTKVNSAAKKGIKLTYNIDKHVEVIADKDMLRIVLRNVINNAVKFTPQGGEVEILFASQNGLGEIAIRDTGIGMDAEKQKEIFTLRSNSTFGTNDEKGIGLGLLLCKEFMIYQKGDIHFKSELGKGSVFYLSLPVALN